jgi:DNA replication protein DnaC
MPASTRRSCSSSGKDTIAELASVPLLIIDDLGKRKLPCTAAEDLLELVMRRYERASTLFTSNRPVEDWGKVLGDAAAVAAMLDPSSTTVTSSSAAPEAGEPRSARPCRPRKLRGSQ